MSTRHWNWKETGRLIVIHEIIPLYTTTQDLWCQFQENLKMKSYASNKNKAVMVFRSVLGLRTIVNRWNPQWNPRLDFSLKSSNREGFRRFGAFMDLMFYWKILNPDFLSQCTLSLEHYTYKSDSRNVDILISLITVSSYRFPYHCRQSYLPLLVNCYSQNWFIFNVIGSNYLLNLFQALLNYSR